MTDEDKQSLIEAFYEGRLSQNEKLIFDDLLRNDLDFSKDVKIYSAIYQGFNALEFENISQLVQQWEKKYASRPVEKSYRFNSEDAKQDTKSNPKLNLFKIISFAAAIVGIFVITYFIFNQQKKDLFAQFFEAPELYLNVRGEESSKSEKNRITALNFYVEKKYNDAVAQLSNYTKDNPEDWEALFYLAVSKMEVKNFNSAISDFDRIIQQKGNAYQESAEWMVMLSHYKNGNKEQCDLYLNLIIDNKSHFYNEKAFKFKASYQK
jgi:TolA-binding protein